MKDYFINIDDLKRIWRGFLIMDRKCRGFANMNHMMEYLDEKNYSPVAPFLERFFDIIDKMDKDVVTFEEFFPALCAFALFTR